MSEERELRAVLEETQERLRSAEARLAEVDRARTMAAQRAHEFELMLEAERQRIAAYEEQARLGGDSTGQTLAQMKARLETLELRLKQAETIAPRLPPGGVCSRCGSSKVAPARIESSGDRGGGQLQAVFDQDPGAAFFKNTMTSRLTIAVCAGCGYVEMTAGGASHLWDAYQRSRSK